MPRQPTTENIDIDSDSDSESEVNASVEAQLREAGIVQLPSFNPDTATPVFLKAVSPSSIFIIVCYL